MRLPNRRITPRLSAMSVNVLYWGSIAPLPIPRMVHRGPALTERFPG